MAVIMAITKIMCMKSAEHGNVSAHLKHSIAYICNEAKTENGSLVGGINCLPDFAYEQMIGTKEMFGQTGGRQGYHFIISLKPITNRLCEEYGLSIVAAEYSKDPVNMNRKQW